MALDFNQYAAQGNTFLKNYAREMNFGSDTEKASRVFTSVLYALRDIIPQQESLQFIAQLPMFIKAVYVNGWNPGKKSQRVKTVADFLNLVRMHDWPAAANDFEYSDQVTERYVMDTFDYLQKYISPGEVADIQDCLPKDLRRILKVREMPQGTR